jgi:spermidine synthase
MAGDRLLLLAFFLSGAAALGYELLWTRLLGLSLGSETLGVLATLAGFFGGMALGALLLHRRAHSSPDPVRLFVVLELVAAGFAVVSPHLLHALVHRLPPLLGGLGGDAGLAARIAAATILLLPGTACLGATLAALVEARRRVHAGDLDGRGLGRLYAANTAGATLGVLLTIYLVLPALGYAVGALVPAACGALAAVLARRWARGRTSTSVSSDMPRGPAIDASRDPDPDLLAEPWLLYLLAFGGGVAGIGLEVVGTQILAQNLENTVYTFANILAVVLVGTAVGAAIYQRVVRRLVDGRPATATLGLLLLLGALVLPAAFALAASPQLLAGLTPEHPSLAQAALAELAVAGLAFFLPTVAWGASFAHVTGLIAASGRGVGRAYAVNTLGCAAAPFLFGLVAVPALGYADALYLVVYLYLALFAVVGWFRRFHPALLVGGVVVLIGLTAAAPRSLVLVAPDDGWTVVETKQTIHGLVLVSEDTTTPAPGPSQPDLLAVWPLRRLQVGKHFRMGGARSFGERRMGHLCALLAEASADAKITRSLFLGLGTGATMGAAMDMSDAEADGVELIPQVLPLLHHFGKLSGDLHKRPHATLHAADARRFVGAADTTWDFVLADLFHPGIDGAGSLYAAEHFTAVRDHLRPGGLFCQWLPLYQLGEDDLKLVVRTFLSVFPEAHAFLGINNPRTPALALVGRVPTADQPQLRLDHARLASLFTRPGKYTATISVARDLLASYLADGTALRAFAGDGPVNTDLRPHILFAAPAAAYADDPDLGARNLAAILSLRPADPTTLLDSTDAAPLRDDVGRYAIAVDLYLRAGIALGDHTDAASFPPAVAEQLLQSFEAYPTYEPVRRNLHDVARQNPSLAELIFPRMLARTPDDPRVYQALLTHLQAIGDQARFESTLAEATARFPDPNNPAMSHRPLPTAPPGE